MTAVRRMRLGLFGMLPGHHLGAWRDPDARPDAATSLADYLAAAQLAERGLFDFVFLADSLGLSEREATSGSFSRHFAELEPIPVLAALAAATRRIGLVATASTSFNEPYHVARSFATVDLMSDGRAGWNAVTSYVDAAARNFGLDVSPEPAARYRRAEEFIDIVRQLWDSMRAGVLVLDTAADRFFDPSKVRSIDHGGEHFRVRGPLNVPPSAQGRPVVVQSGSSPEGMRLGARTAEVVFTAQSVLADGRLFAERMREEMGAFGRGPSELLIMPGLMPVVRETRSEAEDAFARMQDLVPDAPALEMLSTILGGKALSGYDPAGPLPAFDPAEISGRGSRSRQAVVIEQAREQGLTLRDTAKRAAASRGHLLVVGTAADVADVMQEWFEEGAADGFNVMPPVLPRELAAFVSQVVPELQRRGLFRTAYAHATLRANLGLPGSPPPA